MVKLFFLLCCESYTHMTLVASYVADGHLAICGRAVVEHIQCGSRHLLILCYATLVFLLVSLEIKNFLEILTEVSLFPLDTPGSDLQGKWWFILLLLDKIGCVLVSTWHKCDRDHKHIWLALCPWSTLADSDYLCNILLP